MPAQDNSVELIGFYGSDELIACSAWTSTSRDLTDEKRSRIGPMVKKLWMDGHHTPFEKGIVHFLVNSDIATHIHFLKHRISSANSESARYKELRENKYYIPDDWNGIKCSIEMREGTKGLEWAKILESWSDASNELYHNCLADLEPVLGRKRAKETARFFKMYNSQIEMDIMFNLRSFANLQKTRNSSHAQNEIHQLTKRMLELVSEIEGNPFKYTLEAWRESGVF